MEQVLKVLQAEFVDRLGIKREHMERSAMTPKFCYEQLEELSAVTELLRCYVYHTKRPGLIVHSTPYPYPARLTLHQRNFKEAGCKPQAAHTR